MAPWIDRKAPNVDFWAAEADGVVPTWERASLAVLMDIRRELRDLNRLLRCPDFQAIPRTLKAVQKNTTKRRRRPSNG